MVRPERCAAVLDDVLIYEVLVRLPANGCGCFRRSWRAGITGASFVRRHLELSRTRPPSVLAVPREVDPLDDYATSTEISFHRLMLPPAPAPGTTETELIFEKAWPEGITRRIAPTHCDGLVAIATATDRVFVCNPATGEFVALPLGRHNAELQDRDLLVPPVALGFDRWRNCYVVGRYFYRAYGEKSFNNVTGEYSQDYDIGHEVFTIGAGSWELTQDPPHAVGILMPMCTRRAFYWHSDVPKPRLMRFSLQGRTFAVVSRPPVGRDHLSVHEMVDLDGKLCYVHAAAEASFHVWLADDRHDELQWSLHCRIDLHPDPNLIYYSRPVISDGGKMLFRAAGEYSYNHLFWCSVPNNTREKMVDLYTRPDGSKYVGQSQDLLQYVVPYFESLVSLTACNY
uniref:F-box associated beta-propeller type 3 domain-containing protein n=1 Tax=Setaria viridis TaxID=4556 RepID=A0A4U6VI76_SETVI|nr:hypothetical protein SEVIR_3G382200v2 [Setaria viridis]